jgi:hypothetical protein
MAMNTLGEWKRIKTEFERITGEKKPAQTVSLGCFGVYRKSSGLEKALKKCDDLSPYEATVDPRRFNQFIAARDDYVRVKNAYLQQLDTAIKAEKAREVRTVYLKGLKMLKTRLEKFEAVFQDHITMEKDDADRLLKTAEMKVRKAKKKLDHSIASAVKGCIAAIKHIQANPTQATWEAEFSTNGVVGKLSRALAQITREREFLRRDGIEFSYKRNQEARHIEMLSDWAPPRGGKLTVASDEVVLQELGIFKRELKTVAAGYRE